MIAVEIPAALATDPQVVPVDEIGILSAPAMVGWRVALAWRETCPMCDGWGNQDQCGPCAGEGERMVVGWTAEVAEVVPIVDPSTDAPHAPALIVWPNGLIWRDESGEEADLPHLLELADWSPGRYALVLRDVVGDTFFGYHDRPAPCRPFHGFAELDEVL